MATGECGPAYRSVNGALYTTLSTGDTYRYAATTDSWPDVQWTLMPPQAGQSADKSKGEKHMNRYLYEVHVVDPEAGKVVLTQLFIADSEDTVRLKAARALPNDLDVEAYDFIVVELGDVRAKKDGPQEVKVVG